MIAIFFWNGSYMMAIKVATRSKNDCKLGHRRGLIWLQSQFRSGPSMVAIRLNKDQIWLLYRKTSSKHITMILGQISQNENCNHIWIPLNLWLQSYKVSFVAKVAIIFGPDDNFHCNHIWPILEKVFQSYVVQPYIWYIIYHFLNWQIMIFSVLCVWKMFLRYVRLTSRIIFIYFSRTSCSGALFRVCVCLLKRLACMTF